MQPIRSSAWWLAKETVTRIFAHIKSNRVLQNVCPVRTAIMARRASSSATEAYASMKALPSSPLAAPALSSAPLCYSYEIGRGEMGVLSFEPYKSLILPYWAFRTVPIARNSSDILWSIFQSYVERKDFVGADMTRKFIQMGMTRARRYANHKGGRKYAKDTGEELQKWSGGSEEEARKRKEKEDASEIFKVVWRRCIDGEAYKELKADWTREKIEFVKSKS